MSPSPPRPPVRSLKGDLPRTPRGHCRHEERAVVTGELFDVWKNFRLLEARLLEGLSPVVGGQEAVVGARRGVRRDAGEVFEEVEDELDVDGLAREGAHAFREDRRASRLQRLADAR